MQRLSPPRSQAADEIGAINALVNNAGAGSSHPLGTTDQEWDRCFDVNPEGAWNCCKAVLP